MGLQGPSTIFQTVFNLGPEALIFGCLDPEGVFSKPLRQECRGCCGCEGKVWDLSQKV